MIIHTQKIIHIKSVLWYSEYEQHKIKCIWDFLCVPVLVYQVSIVKSRNRYEPLNDYTIAAVEIAPVVYQRIHWMKLNWLYENIFLILIFIFQYFAKVYHKYVIFVYSSCRIIFSLLCWWRFMHLKRKDNPKHHKRAFMLTTFQSIYTFLKSL